MRSLILLPDRNSPGRSDWSGAFKIYAWEFAKLHGIPDSDIVSIDCGKPKPQRKAQVYEAFAQRTKPPLELVVFFTHGLWKSLPQFDLDLDDMLALAGQLASAKVPKLIVVIYGCSTAKGPGPGGDGGLADQMRDKICAAGGTTKLIAHTTPGDAAGNPFCRVFEGDGGTPGGTGGEWIILPPGQDKKNPKGDPLWGRWRKAVASPSKNSKARGVLRYKFPFMSPEEIRTYLSGDNPLSE